ncbi:hypothetical protein F5B22DRAFT_615609 [Xylaria bambusicola]|uniref:uncharacterized protein n=1 Tax=Xylaria bambusicola TaxID=326684 RepID=UPI00200793DD|nr:uncharacterized protein F5B22DRAFT_615609 [Xylaria bambusicola]KAI0509687.1 hypothetical protein F5B22DRAFT_615609 [Xylaria bambusicola]
MTPTSPIIFILPILPAAARGAKTWQRDDAGQCYDEVECGLFSLHGDLCIKQTSRPCKVLPASPVSCFEHAIA